MCVDGKIKRQKANLKQSQLTAKVGFGRKAFSEFLKSSADLLPFAFCLLLFQRMYTACNSVVTARPKVIVCG
jgi:hypothetical protein